MSFVSIHTETKREKSRRLEKEAYDRKRGSVWAKPEEKPWGLMRLDKPWGKLSR